MTNRIIDLSDRPARLSVQNALLSIKFPALRNTESREGYQQPRPEPGTDQRIYRSEHPSDPNEHSVPISDIAVLILSHPQVSLTQGVLAGLAESGAILVACNSKHMPASMLLPLAAHHLQAERFAAQAAMSQPAKKRAWQQIVRAKVRAQHKLLLERTAEGHGLDSLAARVRSGDPGNVEAQAARVYWPALFGDKNFRRDADTDGPNACLNYGYAILRATTARAICGAGMHPCLGIHHRNRYDAFCLADDLMEPFRPLVDREVGKLFDAHQKTTTLDKETKQAILKPLLGRYSDEHESRTLFDWLARVTSSLLDTIEGRGEVLEIPEVIPEGPAG